jgi:uncharacterized protein YajQ (UPF0234 family)
MPSFDIVSELDWSEVKNAINQAQRELAQRYDFKGTGAEVNHEGKAVSLVANSEDRVRAAYDVLIEKLVKRSVSMKHFEAGKVSPSAQSTWKMEVEVAEGIDTDRAKEIVKHLKGTKLKVQAAIVEDKVRVTGKKRDDLQAAISELKGGDFGVELQYRNFRD